MSKGLMFNRRFTAANEDVEETVKWATRRAEIKGADGRIIFEQDGCLFPESWSDQAINVVASKYFYKGHSEYPREHSVAQMIHRVCLRISQWGLADGYFGDQPEANRFYDELYYILLHQMGSFNSPVWFNLGIPNRTQQASACFIQSVQDSMESILDFVSRESVIFKGGSGSGTNFSRIRANGEPLTSGGKASGPVSFMRGADNLAGAIKSGGTTRRAAKMVVLDTDHPDILQFVNCKKDEELKAHALIDAGYDGGFNVVGGAYDTVSFQNANHSVRATDEFMKRAVQGDSPWYPRERVSGKYREAIDPTEVLRQIAEATWICGDPGMQYDDTINRMHTCAATDRIYASNPCSEYMFLDDTACNLASINLLKFLDEDGSFKVDDYIHVCEIFIIAMDIIVGNADYPTEKIKQMSHDYRTLGLGFCNLGSLLMVKGLAYDSAEGRSIAAVLTSILSAAGYRQSARMAMLLGPFKGHSANKNSMAAVLAAHQNSTRELLNGSGEVPLYQVAINLWNDTIVLGQSGGYRNAQISVLAPTGTIAFMMDAGTTGIEPDIALVKYKMLVGGGMFKMTNPNVKAALENLDYHHSYVKEILEYIQENDTIEGSPHLNDNHLPIFDCAFKAQNGTRYISPEGHLKMMAACQPFISGAISKTVNMPTDCTVEDIMNVYIDAWKSGIKAVAVYRDGSKRTQPLNTFDTDKAERKKISSTLRQIEDAEEKLETGEPVIFERIGIEEIFKDFSEGSGYMEGVAEMLKNRGRLSGKSLSDLLPVSPTPQPRRRKMENERESRTHKFSIAGHEGYIIVGLYEDGSPGEVFIKMNKEGSTISGLMDSIAIMISMSLQYGVPVSAIHDKFIHTRFEPSGFTTNPDIRQVSSIMDYVVRHLTKFKKKDADIKFMTAVSNTGVDKVLDEAEEDIQGFVDSTRYALSVIAEARSKEGTQELYDKYYHGNWTETAPADLEKQKAPQGQMDAPPCVDCGTLMIRAGSCYKCPGCGSTTGCG